MSSDSLQSSTSTAHVPVAAKPLADPAHPTDFLLRTQRDLLLQLATVRDLPLTIRLCLQAAMQVSAMECGGIYLRDAAGNLSLVESSGLSAAFVEGVRCYPPESDHAQLVSAGRKIYTRYQDLGIAISEVERQEGLHALAVIPIWDEHGITGCINVASRSLERIPLQRRLALETIASLIGLYISRAQSDQALRNLTQRLQLFIEHAPAALAMFDRQMRYLAVSRRWLDDYRLVDAQIIGLSHYELFPEINERWQQIHQRGLAGEIIVTEEDCLERDDGSVQWLHWEVRPWYTTDGSVGGIVIFSEDISTQKALEQKIIEISTAEQERIGRDIHDGIGQQLTGLSMLAGSLEKRLAAAGNTQEAEEVAAFRQHLQATLDEARTLAHGLSPVQIDPEGLTDALAELAGRIRRSAGVACHFKGSASLRVHDSTVAMHLFRIAQEAVNNALKHAHADLIDIELITLHGELVLMILDNGSGILLPADQRGGIGLHIMRYRASILGGHLDIEAGKGGGTLVRCKVPLADKRTK